LESPAGAERCDCGYRFDLRERPAQALPDKTTHVAAFVLALLVLCGIGLWMLSRNGAEASVSPGNSSREPQVEKMLPATALCAPEVQDLTRAIEAANLSDRAGVESLFEKQKVFLLVKGTNVLPYRMEGKLAEVWVKSGAHSGEHCWTSASSVPN
jgi:hypothetical protein